MDVESMAAMQLVGSMDRLAMCAFSLALALSSPAGTAGTLHVCRQAGVTSYQSTPCGPDIREIRRIAYVLEPVRLPTP